MKKLFLILLTAVLILCSACSADMLPAQQYTGTPVETEEEARERLQSWLDNHTFDFPLTINDEMTTEDDGGFMFVLYQTEEFATIRVVKANGSLLRLSNPEANQYISIDSWYTSLGLGNTSENTQEYSDSDISEPDPVPTEIPDPTTVAMTELITSAPISTETPPTATPTEEITTDTPEPTTTSVPAVTTVPDTVRVFSANDYVRMVRGGFRANNPELTYETAFSAFFSNPRWQYFQSENGINVVEFTGGCIYRDVHVTARIQFIIDLENSTFEATYLAFNEVPQTLFTLTSLLDTVFENAFGEPDEVYWDAVRDSIPGDYDDLVGHSGDFVTYINDGFILTLPSNAKLSTHLEKKAVNQFSISSGAEVPTEKIYQITLVTSARLTILLNIFENEGFRYNEDDRVTVPNADSAYLRKSISDSILERSSYELIVLRDDLIYILETTYHPDYAEMGRVRGQTDFSYEREHLRELLEIFEIMISSFALTDNPVSFSMITSGGTFWQENVLDLIRNTVG